MTATKSDISAWFDQGVETHNSHMIIVCDTFDWDDYPVFTCVDGPEALKKKVAEYNGQNMQKVMEVYDLNADKLTQLNSHRARADLIVATPVLEREG